MAPVATVATASFIHLPATPISFAEVEPHIPPQRLHSAEPPSLYSNIQTWCSRNGIRVHQGVSIASTPQHGSGLFVGIEPIKAGTSILFVPQAMILSADNIEQDSRLEHVIGPLRAAGLDDRGVLALWVLLQSRDPLSVWKEYVSLLPNGYELSKTHLLLMTDSLGGTSLDATVERMRQNISRQIRSIMRALRKLEPVRSLVELSPSELDEAWKWAHAVVMTRSGLATTSESATDWTKQAVSIIPMIDFCNHSDTPNAEVRVNADGSVDLLATRDMEAGEEITISYWSGSQSLSSEQSLFSFGFLSNEDRFVIPGVSFERCDEDPKRAIQRLTYIDASGRSEASQPCLDELGKAIAYFSIDAMPDREILELTRMYLEENGTGPRTLSHIAEYNAAGKLKLLHVLVKWRDEVKRQVPRSETLVDFRHRLLVKLDHAIHEFNH